MVLAESARRVALKKVMVMSRLVNEMWRANRVCPDRTLLELDRTLLELVLTVLSP
mgnify:CR=1 FL=1